MAARKIHLFLHPRAEAPPRGHRTLLGPGRPSRAGPREGADFRKKVHQGQRRLPERHLRRYFPSIGHEVLLRRTGRTIAGRQVMAMIWRIQIAIEMRNGLS